MPRICEHSLPHRPALAAALMCLAMAGCQSNRAVIPPPGGLMNQGDAYYNRPIGETAVPAAGGAPVNLAPGGLPGLPPPPSSSGAAVGSPRPPDTFDVATRVAADGQPIRVLDSTANPGTSLASAPRGMTLNDGTTARGWQTSALPSSIASNPFSQLRGGASSSTSLPQGFSGQDGQWRSRSSYEATERR